MEIKEMTVSDLDLIAENLSKDFNDFWNYNVFKSELENENSKYIVAIKNNKIVGYAGFRIVMDIAHINNIVVKKDLRNEGIGTILLQELIKMCTELKMNEVTLEVNEHNSVAINLYKKFGFKQVGLRKKYYRTGDNAIIMTITILKK